MEQPPPLSASVIGSFAYTTVKDRMPVIVTRVIDYLCREKLAIVAEIASIGEDATLVADGLKDVISRLSQLKNEMQTNKPLKLLQVRDLPSEHDDTDLWNACISNYSNNANLSSNQSSRSSSSSTDSLDGSSVQPRWFTAPWLLVECYMYKRIHHSLQETIYFQNLDPFAKEKLTSLQQSRDAVVRLEQHTVALLAALSTASDETIDQALTTMIQLSVWGNQCDLSLSGGKAVSASEQGGGESNDTADTGKDNDAGQGQMQAWLATRRNFLLIDDSQQVCCLLRDRREDNKHVALVLDNAGYELLTDVCLSLLLVKAGLTSSVVLYVKTRPWFVSDTIIADIDFTRQWLINEGLHGLANEWRDAINSGSLVVRERRYWTTADSFPDMGKTCPDLLQELAEAKLVIFKGDLNYRKLVSDLNWPTDTPLITAVGPSLAAAAPLLALRTVKGGPVVGVQDEVKERLVKELGAAQWDVTGQCGMIQFLHEADSCSR